MDDIKYGRQPHGEVDRSRGGRRHGIPRNCGCLEKLIFHDLLAHAVALRIGHSTIAVSGRDTLNGGAAAAAASPSPPSLSSVSPPVTQGHQHSRPQQRAQATRCHGHTHRTPLKPDPVFSQNIAFFVVYRIFEVSRTLSKNSQNQSGRTW